MSVWLELTNWLNDLPARKRLPKIMYFEDAAKYMMFPGWRQWTKVNLGKLSTILWPDKLFAMTHNVTSSYTNSIKVDRHTVQSGKLKQETQISFLRQNVSSWARHAPKNTLKNTWVTHVKTSVLYPCSIFSHGHKAKDHGSKSWWVYERSWMATSTHLQSKDRHKPS